MHMLGSTYEGTYRYIFRIHRTYAVRVFYDLETHGNPLLHLLDQKGMTVKILKWGKLKAKFSLMLSTNRSLESKWVELFFAFPFISLNAM